MSSKNIESTCKDIVDDVGQSFKDLKSKIEKYPEVFSFENVTEYGWVMSIDLSLLELQLGKEA